MIFGVIVLDIFTNKILPLFEKSGLSDLELEKKIGLPRSIIYDWRKGRSKSYKKYISEISNYFGVSADYLLGNEQKNKPATNSDEPTELEKLILDKISQLDEDGKKLALAQLDALLTVHQENKDN